MCSNCGASTFKVNRDEQGHFAIEKGNVIWQLPRIVIKNVVANNVHRCNRKEGAESMRPAS